MAVDGASRELVASVIMSWLVFVRILCVDWLTTPTCSRTEIREACLGALTGALDGLSAGPRRLQAAGSDANPQNLD
jgi:hypothetical protein